MMMHLNLYLALQANAPCSEGFSNCLVDCCMQDFERKNRGKDLAGNQWCQDALKRERFYGLMGPNQCGTTALMRACA